MKKKMTTALLLIALAATAASGPKAPLQAQAAAGIGIGEEVGITLYGQPFLGERSPLLVNGTVLVPLRGLAESLGAEVDWEEGTQTVTLRKADTSVRLTIGSREASKNGVALRLDTPPQLIGEVTMVPLRLIGESFDAWVTWNGEARMAAIDHLPALPVVGSQENLQLILQQTMSAYSTDLTARSGVAAVPATAPAPLASAQSMRAPASAGSESAPSANSASEMKAKQESSDFSTTNTQVEGVDEADVIKTDGAYLYQVNKDRIVITQAVPAAEMKVASVISFSGATFRPTELYVDDSHLVVIGTTNRSIPGSSPAPQGTNAAEPAAEPAAGAAAKRIAVMPVRPTLSSVKAIVYDITD
ncbi:MAG: hypothetical protein K0Q59_5850, partial [Paenibacillus sp.]|nr:hypothetical protein [Paenibacillus sp.]